MPLNLHVMMNMFIHLIVVLLVINMFIDDLIVVVLLILHLWMIVLGLEGRCCLSDGRHCRGFVRKLTPITGLWLRRLRVRDP